MSTVADENSNHMNLVINWNPLVFGCADYEFEVRCPKWRMEYEDENSNHLVMANGLHSEIFKIADYESDVWCKNSKCRTKFQSLWILTPMVFCGYESGFRFEKNFKRRIQYDGRTKKALAAVYNLLHTFNQLTVKTMNTSGNKTHVSQLSYNIHCFNWVGIVPSLTYWVIAYPTLSEWIRPYLDLISLVTLALYLHFVSMRRYLMVLKVIILHTIFKKESIN